MKIISLRPMVNLSALLVVLLACAACNSTPTSEATEAAPATPAGPIEELQAARAALGDDAEVLIFGALGGEGTQQVVAINRLAGDSSAPQPSALVTGTAVTRVSILNKENGAWSEVLRVDEYLKNSQGYLRGTPPMSVAGWRLEIEQQTNERRVLHFTPLAPPSAAKVGTVSVAWNSKVKRYQSLEPGSGKFRGELLALETPTSKVK